MGVVDTAAVASDIGTMSYLDSNVNSAIGHDTTSDVWAVNDGMV